MLKNTLFDVTLIFLDSNGIFDRRLLPVITAIDWTIFYLIRFINNWERALSIFGNTRFSNFFIFAPSLNFQFCVSCQVFLVCCSNTFPMSYDSLKSVYKRLRNFNVRKNAKNANFIFFLRCNFFNPSIQTVSHRATNAPHFQELETIFGFPRFKVVLENHRFLSFFDVLEAHLAKNNTFCGGIFWVFTSSLSFLG